MTQVHIIDVTTGQVTVREMTPEEEAVRQRDLDRQAVVDADQSARLDDLAAKVALLWAAVFPPDNPDTPPADAPAFDGIWHPGRVITDAGKTWRNVSGTVLTTAPSGFPGTPGQWSHLFVEVTGDTEPEPEPGDRPAWAEGIAYAVGDEVTHNGNAWAAKIAHTSHAGWAPSAATHAVWTDLGPQ